ncbi:hypothetical protein [Nitrosomonas ureae]|uniref:Uncharacterized protein n=1 Tax=Nitrosomonas ureae TaxID=44577 RepID=A0A286AKM3_9PROT|nr:hypothetical protein [Nitrosomonas ureae]SOD22419.1 hypothetical protein SAMN06297164_3473 [Nitrosomonas ureae]
MTQFTKLNNLYWRIRYTRNKSEKRKFYRYVFKEKKRLIESGVDKEELRLLCSALSNTLNLHAERRLSQSREDNFQVVDYYAY